MENRSVFELADLTEAFFEKVWYLEQVRSSGMGGPGHILMITEEKEEYLLGIEGYDEQNPEKTVALLARYDKYDEKERRRRYRAEDAGWTYCSDACTDILIRNDLYEKLDQVYYETEHRKLEHTDCYRLLRHVWKLDLPLPGKVYKETQENRDREEKERKNRECERAKVRLEDSDLNWKPLYMNNMLYNSIWGCYAFLFKRQENGQTAGYKWTVIYQPKEEKHGMIGSPVVIEAYNLYFKRYRNVASVLGYREPGYTDWQCYAKSTIHDGVHSYGEFVRSYKTLERAKEAVLYWNECIGWGNVDKNNIIRVSFDERSIAEMERDYEEKMNKDFVVEKDIAFGELRCYLSQIDRLSICIREMRCYENFICLRDVPESYDRYYVYGIGMIDSEFYQIGKARYAVSGESKDLTLAKCIEVMLSSEPKSVVIKKDIRGKQENGIFGYAARYGINRQ